MRMIVLENRAKASRPGMLQSRPVPRLSCDVLLTIRSQRSCEMWGDPQCRNNEYAARHSFPGTTTRRVLLLSAASFETEAFIAQIAAMKTAFARGRIANVNANAVSGQTVMLTQRG